MEQDRWQREFRYLFLISLILLGGWLIYSSAWRMRGYAETGENRWPYVMTPEAGDYLAYHIRRLADPVLQGRAPGRPGGNQAAAYIAGQFQALGLKPAGDGGTYFQTLSVPGFNLVRQGARQVPLLSGEGLPADNVLGYWGPGLPGSTVVVSAHYDHLGEEGGSCFPGANDNASGVGVLLETARYLVKQPQQPRVNVLFVAFTGEEEGLYGSHYFTEHFPARDIVADINLDTVGNGPEHNFLIWTQRADNPLINLMKDLGTRLGLSLRVQVLPLPDFPHTGDHASFARLGLPAVTLLSSDWLERNHTPRDTPELINKQKLFNALQLTAAVVERLAY